MSKYIGGRASVIKAGSECVHRMTQQNLFTACSNSTSKLIRPTVLIRYQPTPVRSLFTSSRLYEQKLSTQKSSDLKLNNTDDSEPPKELPFSPYGGRFGVPEQPMSTKSLAQAQSNSKRSPFAKAKDGIKSKVHDWTDEEKNLEKRKEL